MYTTRRQAGIIAEEKRKKRKEKKTIDVLLRIGSQSTSETECNKFDNKQDLFEGNWSD